MENCTPYVAARGQCQSCKFDTPGGINRRSCPGPELDAEGCRYYYPRSYPSDTAIYNDLEYINKEKGLGTMSDRLTSDLSMFNKPHWQILADLEAQNAEVERLRTALLLAYLALTDGMADVPSGERYWKCAAMRLEAKRAIRQVLPGMAAEE